MAKVPGPAVRADDIDALTSLLDSRRLAILTGAGCSTESGIPDYRGPETRRRARDPLKYRQFIAQPEARRRYWARAVIGWERFARKEPNPAHRALARLEQEGRIDGLITQNVDRLHHRAGSRNVIELHGALDEVRCLDCDAVEPRSQVQARFLSLNPGWTSQRAELAPDGDADLARAAEARFRMTGCQACGGDLKPHVVFFGESVPPARVERAYTMVDEAEALLVVGSSLAVFSGYRFVKRASRRGIPVALVNLGESRADAEATLRVEARAGELLPRLADALLS
ncbi:MAG: NAD-dependent protein deacetylase [Sandaracinaceae bacterium]